MLDDHLLDRFADRLDLALADVAAGAVDLDAAGDFVEEGVDALRDVGALVAPFPREMGGRGLDASAADLMAVLRRIGRASLSLGRVFEGHANAIRLILVHGTREQAVRAAQNARDGKLFGIWAAERPDQRVRVDGKFNLSGRKAFASAAHHVERALITAELPDGGEQLLLVELPPFAVNAGRRFELHGMRSAGTASFDFNGIRVSPASLIGGPGDYMREPEISLGALRTLVVQLGGLQALLAEFRAEMGRGARADDPHQLARFGRALIAGETAQLWVERSVALSDAKDSDFAAHYIRLARGAVESACLEAIGLAQRSVGLTCFVRPHPIERICRDLATYLRQPALDMVIDEAAVHFLKHDLP